MINRKDLIEEAMQSKDSSVRDMLWGYLSGVDREGSNYKGKSEAAKTEEMLKKQYPNEDVCLLRLKAKYGRSYD